jgi:hypothetical protein
VDGRQKERAPEYLNLFSEQVQPKLSAIRGFRRSLVLVREHGEETEIVTNTFFELLEDAVAFAGLVGGPSHPLSVRCGCLTL